jgi:hypothetical protein
MSEKHAENDENYPRKNQVKCRWPQPSFELFSLLPKRISYQNVNGGIDRRACEVVKKKNAPLHSTCQPTDWPRRAEQGDEPRDKNRPGMPSKIRLKKGGKI